MQGRRSLKEEMFHPLHNFRPVKGRRIVEEKEVAIEQNQPKPEPMEGEVQNNEMKVEMKEFARPMLAPPGSCIRLRPTAIIYELKGIHFNMQPSFYELPSEDPLNFIRDFYGVVELLPLQGLNED